METTNTVVYLIRHSEKMDNKKFIKEYNTNDSEQLKESRKILTVRGEEKAKNLSEKEEFKGIQAIYSGSYSRIIQTAKYFSEKYDIPVSIDDNLNERIKGDVDYNKYPDFFVKQYWEKDFKQPNGESQVEVSERMKRVFWKVVKENKGKKSVVFTSATAMCFLFMNWCELFDVQINRLRGLKFKDKVVINKVFGAPEVFKVTISSNNEILDIENIEFEL